MSEIWYRISSKWTYH